MGDDCNEIQSIRGPSGWTTGALTGPGRSEFLTATDGAIVAYDIFASPPGADIYWQPIGGGTEMQLDLPGVQAWPAMSDGVIVFQSGDVGSRDILVYDTRTSLLYQVTDWPGDDTIADIEVVSNVATVVWTRLEANLNDVYVPRLR